MRGGEGGPAAIVVLIVAFCAVPLGVDGAKGDDDHATVLINGFTATHAAGSPSPFEPLLYAHNRAFAFGFLRVGATSLDLAVVHLASSFPVWRATPARTGDWSRPATLTFDTGLVLTDAGGGVLWRTLNGAGDTVALLNSSNLVIRRYARPLPAWQSFDHPADTLVAGQNFTADSPPLFSANRRFALRLGDAYLALHMEFYGGRATPMYWKHTALTEAAEQEDNAPAPVYGRLNDSGFFGLYVDGGGSDGERRVDVLSFDTFARNVSGGVSRRMTLDDDGNLRAYYWADDESTAWTAEYEAISDRCGLPTSCGAYGLCVPGSEAQSCQCLLTNATGTSSSAPCHDAEEETADLCVPGGSADFYAVRRTRVSAAYKERLPFSANTTAAECERACARNCSCWAALHSGGGATGYCYLVDFPVETLLYEADDQKAGYFKARKQPVSATARRGMGPGVRAATAVLALVLTGLVAAGAYTGYRAWERKRRRRGGTEQELPPGPYKDLKSMGSSNSSFRA